MLHKLSKERLELNEELNQLKRGLRKLPNKGPGKVSKELKSSCFSWKLILSLFNDI